jgi:hypothetical protein
VKVCPPFTSDERPEFAFALGAYQWNAILLITKIVGHYAILSLPASDKYAAPKTQTPKDRIEWLSRPAALTAGTLLAHKVASNAQQSIVCVGEGV